MGLNWQQITEDYAQKYQGTWGLVSIKGREKELFFLEAVEYTGAEPFLHLRNAQNGAIILRYDTENEIEFSFPEFGVHQLDQYAVVLFRKHLRQFKKGFCNGTSALFCPYHQFIPWPEQLWKEEVIKKLFEKQKRVYITTALDQLKSGMLSVRLDDKFSIGLNVTSSKDYILWYLDIPVGLVNQLGMATIKEQRFSQEWQDYTIRSNPHRDYYL